jgi:hypothetical protein
MIPVFSIFLSKGCQETFLPSKNMGRPVVCCRLLLQNRCGNLGMLLTSSQLWFDRPAGSARSLLGLHQGWPSSFQTVVSTGRSTLPQAACMHQGLERLQEAEEAEDRKCWCECRSPKHAKSFQKAISPQEPPVLWAQTSRIVHFTPFHILYSPEP